MLGARRQQKKVSLVEILICTAAHSLFSSSRHSLTADLFGAQFLGARCEKSFPQILMSILKV